jgi:hypothetical protein
MSVYVDMLLEYGWKLGPSCHMTADTEQELHEMAAKIGMKRSWFQSGDRQSIPHYDLVRSKRMLAIKHGAVEIDRDEVCKRMEEYWASNRKEVKPRVHKIKSPAFPRSKN